SYIGSNKSVSNTLVDSFGGAVFVTGGRSITIEDSVFTDNHGGVGGALYARVSGKLSLLRTALFGNDAGIGGAIFHLRAEPGNPVVDLRNVSAVRNRATLNGGVLPGSGGVLASDSPLILYNNTFWRNSAAGSGDNLSGLYGTGQ